MRLPLIYSKSSSFSRCFEFAGNCILVLAGGRQIGGKHNIYIYIVILLLIEIYFDSLGFFHSILRLNRREFREMYINRPILNPIRLIEIHETSHGLVVNDEFAALS